MIKLSLAAFLIAVLPGLGGVDAHAAEQRLAARLGVVVTPKNFPNQSAEDVTDMFRLNAELGSFSVIRVNWNDAKRWEAAQVMMGMAERNNLATVLEFTAFKADEIKGASLDPPKDVIDAAGKRVSFTVPAVVERFNKAVLELAELKPAYLAVATDVNLLQMSDAAEFEAFAEAYRKLYPQIKKRSPGTRVYVSFQWDALQARDVGSMRKLVDSFAPQLDLLSFTADPRRVFEKRGVSAITPAYFGRISDIDARGAPVFLNVTWPSEGNGGDAEQAAFVRDLPRLTASLKPAMVAWTFLHDVKVLLFFTARLGLIGFDGKAKPALAAWRELSTDRPVAAAAATGPVTLTAKCRTRGSRPTGRGSSSPATRAGARTARPPKNRVTKAPRSW
jgi:hypothetical protein